MNHLVLLLNDAVSEHIVGLFPLRTLFPVLRLEKSKGRRMRGLTNQVVNMLPHRTPAINAYSMAILITISSVYQRRMVRLASS